jgi:hypothetical protein
MSQDAFLRFDFESWYPYKFWVSSWSSDESYPEGFRYKILSGVNSETNAVKLVLLLEEANGDKTEMKRLEADLKKADGVAKIFVDGLSESYELDFEEQDYSEANSKEQRNVL